jgi:hypothetical protein
MNLQPKNALTYCKSLSRCNFALGEQFCLVRQIECLAMIWAPRQNPSTVLFAAMALRTNAVSGPSQPSRGSPFALIGPPMTVSMSESTSAGSVGSRCNAFTDAHLNVPHLRRCERGYQRACNRKERLRRMNFVPFAQPSLASQITVLRISPLLTEISTLSSQCDAKERCRDARLLCIALKLLSVLPIPSSTSGIRWDAGCARRRTPPPTSIPYRFRSGPC